MIHGYPWPTTVCPGHELRLHVSTKLKRFAVDLFVHNARREHVRTVVYDSQGYVPAGAATADWGWPAYPLLIPFDWPSGVYVAILREATDTGAIPNVPPSSLLAAHICRQELLFVVGSAKPGTTGRILYKLPLATYHAYNAVGGASLYKTPWISGNPPGRIVTLARPGGGVGGFVPCAPDIYCPGTIRQTFLHWDAEFIAWLFSHDYKIEFCTGLDLHCRPELLDSYTLLLCSAHDEYWSDPERSSVAQFVSRGGNVAFFGGNTCWWRIHYNEDAKTIVCNKDDLASEPTDQWWRKASLGSPEDSLTGVSYRHAGGWWSGTREALGYIVQHAKHWIYQDSGLSDGDQFGHDSLPPLIGYECDGVPLAALDRQGRASVHPDAALHGTPASVLVLGAAKLSSGWQDLPPREGYKAGEGLHAATMVLFENGGTVFNAATVDWVKILARGRCLAVNTITQNVLNRLSRDR
jgi:hypothetical protein